ncbi:hypothetical protein QN277_003703 [Acacia crassicarpa]|uniref:Reverse transcriptase Ty1/copia-type domain-containing protein n=1 Tax=Acacia crassicarpa TaxID=499986 RepID=A0AAE1IZ24_9FABA|nr:hypothetical protein QN277_003703 [Acacia crassicarpa]
MDTEPQQEAQGAEPSSQVQNEPNTGRTVSPIQRNDHESNPRLNPDEYGWPIALRKGVRSCTQHPIQRFVSYGNLSTKMQSLVVNSAQIKIPNTFQQAMADPNWKQAAEEELRALKENRTWEITPLPKGKKPVGCRWIFTPKFNPDGSINKYKARLVAKGYTQTYGIDYQETFAPVVKFNTIQVLLSIAANLDWSLHQLDVKNAFLNGDLEEEVYMEIPDGVLAPNNSVCKLNKSLYGLKQSPRAWFSRFTKAVKELGYTQGQADDTLFIKRVNDRVTILVVYVDDIIITGNDEESITLLKQDLSAEFQVKDLGQMRYFLGLEIARTKKGINVSQRKYTLDLLHETGMLGSQPEGTPMEEGCHLQIKPKGIPTNSERYRRIVGKLIYLTHTRPDISYAVGIVSQFMHQPQEEHMKAVYRILSYLKLNPGRGILFKKGTARNIEIYTDADHARDRETRRSTSGYCTYVWGNLVTWRSKKQTVVSPSSTEAELRAVNKGVCEGLWIMRLLKEIGIQFEGPIQLWCDNKSSIEMVKNPVYHDRTKHVDIDRHFIKEKIEAGTMTLSHIRSANQIADILTKPLGRAKFEVFRSKLGMIDIYSPA